MTNQEYEQLRVLQARIAALERERALSAASDVYGRFYGPLAVLSLAVLCMPILSDVVIEDDRSTLTHRYGTLWQMIDTSGGGAAFVAIMLMVGLVALLVSATVRVRGLGQPIAIAVIATLLLVMLLAKPGTGDPTPEFAAGGYLGIGVGVAAFLTSVVHAIHLSQHTHATPPNVR